MFDSTKAEQLFRKTMSLYSKDPETYLNASIKDQSKDDSVMMLKCMGRCGITYFIVVTSIIFSCTFTTMPVVYSYDTELLRYRQALSLFILLEVVLNFYLTCSKRSFYEPVKNLSQGKIVPGSDWRKCIDCDHSIPPRAHHCSLCQKCVLKRDHHCFFTGCCVGFENQRYFIVFCFYCAAAASYGVLINYHYLSMLYGPITLGNFFHYLLPVTVFEWIFGYTDFTFLAYSFLIDVCLVTATGTTGIFCWQFFVAVYGKTTFELLRRAHVPRKGILGPVRSVFGSYWMLNFIFPMTCFKQQGNGIEWERVKSV